jgi:DNA processing protein
VLDRTAWIALSLTDRVGGKTIRALVQHFGDIHAVLQADSAELQTVPGIGPKIAESICAIDLDQTENLITEWRKEEIEIWVLGDPTYPARLKDLEDAPPVLFVRGQCPHERAAAVVGTRTPSAESENIAKTLSAVLAEQGYTVVSGLARGVDTNAHLGALSVQNGRTLAVLGSGVLNIYPQENLSLVDALLINKAGALMSEAAPSLAPSSSRLVARNRIISGISQAVIVIETGVDGGAMHAARRALEQGREIYALDITASGNRALIEAGAEPINPDFSNLDLLFASDV